ncbi:acyltransferase [Sphaerisporangium album]|uniref:Acyltransferase n=1 Tax=Sphaerisporangium album TaxID=509200 RepID=A0A367EXG3_9ACTN|nr:acyltransferase [Sphaerisporangium album]RCG22818.1 acyltransferase [Sphaerisporangium album]
MTAANIDPPLTTRSRRRPELDAIRALVVVGLVFFHSALVFDTRDDYYVKNPETTDATMIAAGFGVVWAMPMLFLIAGLGSWYSLRRRGAGGFAVERLLRLGVPLVFATLALLPFPQWIRLRADPAYHESYPRFLPRFFDVHLDLTEFPFIVRGRYFESGHLWFVVMLLAYALLLALVVARLPRERGRRIRELLATAVRPRGAVLLLPAVPVALITALAGMEEPFAGWSRWAYLLFFLYGFVLASDDRFRAVMRRDAIPAVVCAVILLAIGMPGFLVAGDAPGANPFTDMTALAIGVRTLYGAAGWCCLVAILGVLDRRRSARTPVPDPTPVSSAAFMSGTAAEPVPAAVPEPAPARRGGLGKRVYAYLAAAVLPLYVLHQPIVVGVASWVVRWNAPMPVKYLAIVAISLTLTVAAYDLLVRRTAPTRFLFGMRGPVSGRRAAAG